VNKSLGSAARGHALQLGNLGSGNGQFGGGHHGLAGGHGRQRTLAFELAPLEQQARSNTFLLATSDTLMPAS